MKRYSSTTKANSFRTLLTSRPAKIAGFCALLVLLAVLFPRAIGSVTSVVFHPLASVEAWLTESTGAIPSYFRDRAELLEEQSTLRMQLSEHVGARLRVVQLEEENESLRTLLTATSSERVAAGVIGRPTVLPYDVFLIDKGRDDGVVENAPVYIANDQVIGFVAAAYDDSSVVTLVTTPTFTATVYIYGPNIYTTAVGQGGGSLRVSVPQGIELKEGNVVVIPSLDSGIYGEVSVVDSVPSRPEQYGYVSINEALSSIRFVSVGRDPLPSMTFEEAKEVVDAARAEFLNVPVPSGILIEAESDISTSTASTTEDVTPESETEE